MSKIGRYFIDLELSLFILGWLLLSALHAHTAGCLMHEGPGYLVG